MVVDHVQYALDSIVRRSIFDADDALAHCVQHASIVRIQMLRNAMTQVESNQPCNGNDDGVKRTVVSIQFRKPGRYIAPKINHSQVGI